MYLKNEFHSSHQAIATGTAGIFVTTKRCIYMMNKCHLVLANYVVVYTLNFQLLFVVLYTQVEIVLVFILLFYFDCDDESRSPQDSPTSDSPPLPSVGFQTHFYP